MNKHFILALALLLTITGFAQVNQAGNKYSAYFAEAYRKYPRIPRGVLEAVAYTNTRMQHIVPEDEAKSCQGLPKYYGVMGLVEDGKGYFQENLLEIARYSRYDIEAIKNNPRINILAYAAAYNAIQSELRMTTRGIGSHEPIISRLSEIPQDRSIQNSFATDQQFYSILKEMEQPHTPATVRSREVIDFKGIFGEQNLRVLSSPGLRISEQEIRNLNNEKFIAPQGTTPSVCTHSNNTPDYQAAIWVPANRRNYGSREGEPVSYVTIHTIQGSYASAISWFKNPNAGVSAHYIIRASDGQVTQMVCEKDKGFHVRTDNAQAVGIEHEGFVDEGTAWYTNEMYESSARLVQDIAKRHNINPLQTFGGPPTKGVKPLGNKCYRIKGHQHFRGNDHIDPGPYWDWDRYYRLINEDPELKVFTQKKGTIEDPGGNQNYGDQARVAYLIKPPNATAIKLEFSEFEMEGGENTSYDYLDIYDGENETAPFLGRYTGSKIPKPIIARSGAVFMEFRSDCQINKKGWKLSYATTRKSTDCPVPTNLTATNLFPMGATLSWQAVNKAAQYYLYVKRRNLDQKWEKYRTTASSVTLTGLGANSLYQWELQAVCGNDTSARVGGNFTTPGVSQRGSPKIYSISLNRGKINDSGGTHAGYINNEAYIYRILPPNGRKVVLTFEEFDTESCCDFLIVYDGSNTNAPVIDTLAGSLIPNPIVSTGAALTLLFVSDQRTTAKGWKARWTTGGLAEDLPIADNGNTGGNTGGNTKPDKGHTSPAPVLPKPDNSPFIPNLTFASTAPETSPRLKTSYASDFTLQFDDKDKGGRGLANRFYNIAENTPSGWRSNPAKGFFFDDFDRGLHPDWKKVKGNWSVSAGHLVQTNESEGNSNIYASLTQNRNQVYVYNWRARLSGKSNNKRLGLHFFCSDPANSNRGNSYFVWIRDAAEGDKAEIYKTIRDRFERKAVKSTSIKSGEVYDYKVIYNPQKGRIELYINNKFIVSYNDPSPLTSGRGISLRTGNSIATYDDLIVFRARSRSVKLTLGSETSKDIRRASPRPGQEAFRVHSLIVDRNIRWSRIGTAGAQVNFGDTPGDEGNTGIPENKPTNDPTSTNNNPLLLPKYSTDFNLRLPTTKSFYLVADYDGRAWGANPLMGFFLDEFSGLNLRSQWTPIIGDWRTSSGRLEQRDESATNSNIYIPLTQTQNQVYLYHFRARLQSAGPNKRFGFHFFSSDAKLTNRGDSYMVWFRNHEDKPDKVEIYRSDNNELALEESAIVNLSRNKWVDVKLKFNSSTGMIEVFLDNINVLSWRDKKPVFNRGRYISFRTGSSRVQFDDLRVYRQSTSRNVQITVGNNNTDMIRFKSQSNRPAARVYVIGQSSSGRWTELKQDEAMIE